MTQPTKNLNETYRFSRDYTATLQLLKQGHQIMATVGGNDHQQGSIARAVYYEGEGRIMIDANDQTVFAFPPEDLFSRRCEKMNIQFLLPTANIVRPEADQDKGEPLSTDQLVEELRNLDRVLDADGYKAWTYARLAVSGSIKFIQENQKPTVIPFKNPTVISFDLANGPDVSAETTYFTAPFPASFNTIEPTPENLAKHSNNGIIKLMAETQQTDKLHFHPTDEDQNEQEDSNLRRFRSIENPPIIKTAEQIREEFYPGGDARAYDHDEIYLMKEYGKQFSPVREFCQPRTEMTCNCLFSPIQNEREFQERMIKRVYPNFPYDSFPWQHFNGLLMLAVGKVAYEEEVEVMNNKDEKRKDFE